MEDLVILQLHPSAAPTQFLNTFYIGALDGTTKLPDDVIRLSETTLNYEFLGQDSKGSMSINPIHYSSDQYFNAPLLLKRKDILWIRDLNEDDHILIAARNDVINKLKQSRSKLVQPGLAPAPLRRK